MARRTDFARFFNVCSGKAPIDYIRLCKLPLAAKSLTTETHPSGLFQNVSKMRMYYSDLQKRSQLLIQPLRIFLISRLLMGTSLTQ